MRIFSIFLIVIAFATALIANPVIYQDGKMVDLIVDSKTTDAQFFYSLSSRIAMGYRYFEYSEIPSPTHVGQINLLLKRRNTENSQANIYLLGGLGAQGDSITPYIGGEADWENRRVYISAFADQLGGDDPMSRLVLRAGVAPYLAEFNELNSWFIIQVSQLNSDQEKETWALPMLRLFKDNVLLEVGSNGTMHQATFRVHF
jgi:hypothetical protein